METIRFVDTTIRDGHLNSCCKSAIFSVLLLADLIIRRLLPSAAVTYSRRSTRFSDFQLWS